MLKRYLKKVLLIAGFVSLISCDRDKDDIETKKPVPPVEPTVELSPLRELVKNNEFIKDSAWKDGITHTVNLKIGPDFFLPVSSKKEIFPGAILSKNNIPYLEKREYHFEKLPVQVSIGDNVFKQFIPIYANFNSVLNEHNLKNIKQFQSATFDVGRRFSTYNDLALLHGYKNEPATNWLTINNRQSKARKTGIVFTFEVVDFLITMDIPRKENLINRNKYNAEIEADSLVYVNQISIGKRAFLTFMCDTTYDVANAIIAKLKKKEQLDKEEKRILKEGEIGYALQGYNNKIISLKDNAAIVNELYETIKNTNTPGEPIKFFVRGLKDYSPYTEEIKVDIIRK